MKARPPILEVANLSVSYDRIAAVRSVSFSVGEGELVALIGSGGCLELAIVGESAAERLGVAPGEPVVVAWE